ncbi:hypothetical protein MKHDV_01265 [Halodesulfovibrio sp. MK-HDV]|nr:hypothetical protein MKHDV_01265 [Halodesulfovibrio sp. MK-HDV]
MQHLTPQEIFDVISQDFGSKVRFTEADRVLCDDRKNKCNNQSPQDHQSKHQCFLRYDGCCGAHNTGRIAYLINPDHEKKFEITLNVHVTIDEETFSRELLLVLPPSTKLGLSCTKTFTQPEATLRFTILTENIV